MAEGVILAIDGGATRTRCLAVDRAGSVLGRCDAGPANHLLTDAAVVRNSLMAAIDGALAAAGLPRSAVRCVAAGLAGVDHDGAGAEAARELFDDLDDAVFAIAGDMVIAHLAAFEGDPGVLALAGTGSAIFGIGPDGRGIKAGGWGPLFGNEGSAYRIGRDALTAAARAHDGAGPATSLVDAIVTHLELRDFRETVAWAYGGSVMDSSGVASLAPVVARSAEAGDGVARAILETAGQELAEGVAAVAARLQLAAPLVSYQGPVLETCAVARDAFIRRVAERLAGARVVAPRHPPVMGACALGRRALDWPPPQIVAKNHT
jgi:N-acetylglucosamine kinase-like BadF-type ATPase